MQETLCLSVMSRWFTIGTSYEVFLRSTSARVAKSVEDHEYSLDKMTVGSRKDGRQPQNCESATRVRSDYPTTTRAKLLPKKCHWLMVCRVWRWVHDERDGG